MAQPRPAVSVPTPPRRPRPERPSTAPDLAVGLTRACAITAPDRLTCWGAGAPPQHKAMPGVVQVEVDSEHVCTLLGSGEVRCWDSQSLSQLGAAMEGWSPAPVRMDLPEVVELADNSGHTCARTGTGDVYCWGRSLCPDQVPLARPTRVRGLERAARIAVGYDQVCAIATHGGVYCWGYNRMGEVGVPLPDPEQDPYRDPCELVPRRVRDIERASAVALGLGWSCAIVDDGRVRCWGNQGDHARGFQTAEVALPERASALTLGRDHACVLTQDARVRCWGANSASQRGNGTLLKADRPALVPGLDHVALVAAGAEATCVLTEDGRVACWGSNEFGLLGDGASHSAAEPVAVDAGQEVVEVAAGDTHTCVRDPAGSVRCWGNTFGAVDAGGVGGPTLIASIHDAVELAAGTRFTCARRRAGDVVCWGENQKRQLGLAPSAGRREASPVPGVHSAEEIAAGTTHACARLADDTVICWGGERHSSAPTAVSAVTGVAEVAAGDDWTCVRHRSGSIRCWEHGSPPGRIIGGVQGARQIVMGHWTACALLADDKVSCWGRRDSRATAAETGFSDVQRLVGGAGFLCAVTRGHEVQCRGRNSAGELGRKTKGDRDDRAGPVHGLGAVRAVFSGSAANHACAIAADAGLYCWGSNTDGALGVWPWVSPTPVFIRMPASER